MMQCPNCGTNLSVAKTIALSSGFHCPGCNSHLKISGFTAIEIAAIFFPIMFFSGSWLGYLLGLALYVGLLVFLFRKFAKVSVIEP
jgi:hypothetical protein